MRYKFSILNTYHPDNKYLRQQGCLDPWLFSEAKRGPQAKTFWNKLLNVFQLVLFTEVFFK